MGKVRDCSALSWEGLQPSGSTPPPSSTGETEARTERLAAQVTQASGSGAGAPSSLRKAGGTRPPRPHGAGERTSKPLPARGFEIPG